MLLTLNYVGVDESWTVLDVSWKVEVAATQNSSAGVTALDPKGRLASFLTCKKTDALSHLTRTSFPYVDFNLSHYETSHKIVRLKKGPAKGNFHPPKWFAPRWELPDVNVCWPFLNLALPRTRSRLSDKEDRKCVRTEEESVQTALTGSSSESLEVLHI